MAYNFNYNSISYSLVELNGRFHLEESLSKYRPESHEKNILIEFLSANGFNKNDLIEQKKTTYECRRLARNVVNNQSNINTDIHGKKVRLASEININKLFEFNNKYSLSNYLADESKIKEALIKGIISENDVKKFKDIKNQYSNIVEIVKILGDQVSKIFVDTSGNELVTNKSSIQLYDSGGHIPGTHCRIRDYIWLALYDRKHKNGNFSVSLILRDNILSIKVMPSNSNKNKDTKWQYDIYDDLEKRGLISHYDIEYNSNNSSAYYFQEIAKGTEVITPFYDKLYEIIDSKEGNSNDASKDNDEKMLQKSQKDGYNMNNTDNINKFSLNMILYGPPGTGKTYYTRVYAVAICDNKTISEVMTYDYENQIIPRFNELVDLKRIQFTTFHQSYGYEQFIEGILPKLDNNNSSDNLSYYIKPGIFKKFCCCDEYNNFELDQILSKINDNAQIFKISLGDVTRRDIKDYCFNNGVIRIEWDEKNWEKELDKLKTNDIVLSLKTSKTIDAIGIIENDENFEIQSQKEYTHAKKVKWILKNKEIDITKFNDGLEMRQRAIHKMQHMNIDNIRQIIAENYKTTIHDADIMSSNRVFIIDEINRGNISKIFGELITLIEPEKRKGASQEQSAILPYSQKPFSIPKNVYILGTMNTADRSIAIMDTALRRRFDFIEMMPNSNILNGINIDGLNIKEMLDTINKRITVLYDRDHTIGHAYFTCLNSESTIKDLALIFKNKIIPLLQEYFYEDYEKIRQILGDNAKDSKYQFIQEIENKPQELFKGKIDEDEIPEYSYSLNQEAFYDIDSYKQIIQ